MKPISLDQKLTTLFATMTRVEQQERKEQEDKKIRTLTKKRHLWWQKE